MNYKWNIIKDCKTLEDIFEAIAKSKNLTIDELKQTLTQKSLLRNPILLPNVELAAKKIKEYISVNKKILIAGDYDCDGVTSVATMVLGLTYLKANVDWLIPLRHEGYGLNKRIIDYAKDNKFELIITVDNGIAAHEMIRYANSLGIEVIVTDHHQWLTDTLPTDITVNPCIDSNYVFPEICGVMVVYKVLRVLIPDLHKLPLHNELICLTLIGTISDVMPLIDENRAFVKLALPYLKENTNYGLKALLEELKLIYKPISAQDLAFSVCPVINAIGRLKDASIAVKMFLSDDEITAKEYAHKLIDANTKRKQLQNDVIQSIVVNESEPFIIQEVNIPMGLIGIIAGKIASMYQRPCIMLHRNGNILGGSGRCPNTFDISSIIDNNLIKGGGHPGACGILFDANNLDKVKKHCNKLYIDYLNSLDPNQIVEDPVMNITGSIPASFITDDFVDLVHSFEPFGERNSEPIFVIKNLDVDNYNIVGSTKNTVQIKFNYGLKGIAFNEVKDKFDELNYPNKIHCVFKVNYNYWMGKRSIQLMIEDVAIAY